MTMIIQHMNGLPQPSFNSLHAGQPQSLCQYKGKVLLVVNTASCCGCTGQYEALYRKHWDRGLVVLAEKPAS